ncbi:hypothetical protein [Novipirellula rosea]|uniref:Uncharacterized protein n=1 Tax=Novipirellula rosea TaxID=1031540 RepID=A0ABP8MR89_9BACT
MKNANLVTLIVMAVSLAVNACHAQDGSTMAEPTDQPVDIADATIIQPIWEWRSESETEASQTDAVVPLAGKNEFAVLVASVDRESDDGLEKRTINDWRFAKDGEIISRKPLDDLPHRKSKAATKDWQKVNYASASKTVSFWYPNIWLSLARLLFSSTHSMEPGFGLLIANPVTLFILIRPSLYQMAAV